MQRNGQEAVGTALAAAKSASDGERANTDTADRQAVGTRAASANGPMTTATVTSGR